MAQSRDRLEAARVTTAWLTLDPSDNDVSRFLRCLAAAIGGLHVGTRPVPLPDDDGELALRLMETLAALDHHFALFLDDFESVQNSTVLGLVREAVDYLPPGGRLVIGSRNVPDLGFARLRAQGALLEVEQEDLRFTPEETADFLRERRALTLNDEQLHRLHASTEGWAAALWLASLALERRPDPTAFIDEFSGSSTAIADYLAEDVLAQLPPDLQQFLLQTSILAQLTPELCDAVTSRSDSAALLQQLEHRNLFLIPQDDQRCWYRYHSLFADFLRSQLRQTRPQEIGMLHRRAARWYRAHDRPIPTIEHALASGDYKLALPLLDQHGEALLTQSRFRLLARWLDDVPTDALLHYPVLRVIHVWATAYSRGYMDAMRLLERIDPSTLDDPRARAHHLAVRPTLLVLMDRPEDGYAEGKRSMQLLQRERSFPYSMLTNSLAYLAMILGHHQEARTLLDESRRAQESGEGRFNMIYSESVEAIIDLLQGRLRQAIPRLQLAAGSRIEAGTPTPRGSMVAGIPLAELLYEANACEQAERLLNVYLPLVKGVRLPDQLISGHVILARLAAVRGELAEAHQLLTELEYLGHSGRLARVVSSARLERARLYLASGDRDAAVVELTRARDRQLWRRIMPYSLLGNDVETLAFGRLRLLVSGHRPQRAVPILLRAIEAAQRANRQRRALKLRVLLATALQHVGQQAQAREALDAALAQAAPEGFIRTFVDEAAPTVALVRERLAALQAGASGPELPAGFRRHLLDAVGMGEPASTATPAETVDQAMEPLTPREHKVLELLAEGESNQAIGGRLFISETTVRTHLRNINAKLGARNRTQAVAIARRLRLIA